MDALTGTAGQTGQQTRIPGTGEEPRRVPRTPRRGTTRDPEMLATERAKRELAGLSPKARMRVLRHLMEMAEDDGGGTDPAA